MTDTANTAADPALLGFAAALAEAEIAAESATAEHREAVDVRATILSRIATLEAARREIGARRAAGDLREDDRADLAVVAADLEALGGILAQQDAVVAEARAAAERAVRALDQARAALTRAELKRTADALTPRLEELDELLLETIRQANDIERRLGRGQASWVPSVELESALVPFFATRPR